MHTAIMEFVCIIELHAYIHTLTYIHATSCKFIHESRSALPYNIVIHIYTEFGIRYIVPNTETVLGTLFQDLGIRYIIPNTVFRY